MERRSEAEQSVNTEQPLQKPLEAPFVKIVRKLVHDRIPEHEISFGLVLDEINEQITGDGLFQWESKIYPGVKFLAGHLRVTPELIGKIVALKPKQNEVLDTLNNSEPTDQRLKHYAYFIQPWLGLGEDGSALSDLDTGIDRFIREMPRIARAMRNGEEPPTVDILLHGDPTGLGGKASRKLVDKVKKDGFEAYGEINAEFMMEHLPPGPLDETRVVIQGGSKGTVTADKTSHYLPQELRERAIITEIEDEEGNISEIKGKRGVQRLYDNTSASHGTGKWELRNVPTQLGRGLNMGIGMVGEIALRYVFGGVKGLQFTGQGQFYKDILVAKGIPEDSDEEKKLKGELWLKGEIKAIGKGTPLDETQRTFSRISTPDSVNTNYANAQRVARIRDEELILGTAYFLIREVVNRLGGKMKPWARRGLIARKNGRILTFSTTNIGHNYPWIRGINSGGWAQKMEYVENTTLPKSN